jgi:hypothetical protein
LQHRREQQINALVLWHASRLEQADSLWTDAVESRRRALVCVRHQKKH